MNYTRNSNLEYYNEHPTAANCGSYALRLNEWYDPEQYFEDETGWIIEDWIKDQGPDYSDEELSDMFSEILVEGMLIEFKDELEICDGRPPTTKDVELIAFNSFCEFDPQDNCADYDFHFMVFRNGKWKQKCGAQRVTTCTINDWGKYIGNAIYMYHKIGESND